MVPATEEAEARGSKLQEQSGQHSKTLSKKEKKLKKNDKNGRRIQLLYKECK